MARAHQRPYRFHIGRGWSIGLGLGLGLTSFIHGCHVDVAAYQSETDVFRAGSVDAVSDYTKIRRASEPGSSAERGHFGSVYWPDFLKER